MKRTPLNRKTPLKRGTKRLKRSPLSRTSGPSRTSRLKGVGRRKRRQMREGTSYGPLADFVRQIGECQAREELPDACGWLPGRNDLEVCHAGTKSSGQYDWVRAPDGERVGNLWLGCPRHHDYADGHKRETLDWMRETARKNGEKFDGQD